MFLGIQRDMQSEGVAVSVSRLCHWFEVPRRTIYYKPTKAAPKVQDRFVKPMKPMIDQDPSYGYRTLAGLLNFNKNTVQLIFQIRGWQVKRRPIRFRLRVQGMHRWPIRQINGGQPTCAEFGRAEMVGPASMQAETRQEARPEVFEYIEGFYNPFRCHKYLDQLSPLEFERHQNAIRRLSRDLEECHWAIFLQRCSGKNNRLL